MDETPETPPEPAAAVEAQAEPVAPEPPKFRLIKRETWSVEETLTPEEKARANERANERGEELMRAEGELELAKEMWRERNKTLQAKVDASKDELREALRARHTGIETRRYKAERRAMVAACTIDLVRLDTGETVETRPMTEAEQAKWCRQGTIDEATSGATIKPGAEGEPVEPVPPDALSDDDCDALGLPKGWLRAWRDQTWDVSGATLAESDLREVYIRLADTGTTLAELVDGREGVAAMDWLDEARVRRALVMLTGSGLTTKLVRPGEQAAWAPTVAIVVEEPEPGRADPLPEAADAPKPKRQGKKATKADKLVNAAAEQSDGWGL